jgi:crotonobetainyl-CoA:carnitine CoA-transferase CaiB-like acyl-CoA transferase
VGGLNARGVAADRLLHRSARGEGQHVDLAQVECMFPLVAPWLIAQSAMGSPAPASATATRATSPTGAFPCVGEGWIAIAVTDDAAWARLATLLDRPDIPALDAARAAPARTSWRPSSLPGRVGAAPTPPWPRCRPSASPAAWCAGRRVAA